MIANLVNYKTFPIWYINTIPEIFRESNRTDEETWIKLAIFKGEMEFATLDNTGNITGMHYFSVDNQPPFIIPQHRHKIVTVSDDIECQLSFYCDKKDYCRKKYGLPQTHSNVIKATKIIAGGKALDLGCGSGRNALYLNLFEFDVDAVDKNENCINNLNQIIKQDYLTKIKAKVYDINQANLTGHYDLIISTSVMMFLQPDRISDIINNMQNITNSKGYNLIVNAMSTADYPCSIPFPFTFKKEELRQYYQNWNIIEYNENVEQLHKTDHNGNHIQLRFATLLAQKK